MVLLGLAALQHPGTMPPRMCPLEYTKETPSTLPRPSCRAAPANDGDKNYINFKGGEKSPEVLAPSAWDFSIGSVPGQKADVGKIAPQKTGFTPVEL